MVAETTLAYPKGHYVNKHVLDEKRLSRIVQTIPSSLDRSALLSHLAVTGQWRLDAGAVPEGLVPPVMVSAPLTVGRVVAWLRAAGHVDMAERLEPTQEPASGPQRGAEASDVARPSQVVWSKDVAPEPAGEAQASNQVEYGPWACRDVVGGLRYFKSREHARKARLEGESVIKVVES